jgi:hypothetical protein
MAGVRLSRPVRTQEREGGPRGAGVSQACKRLGDCQYSGG